jgi:hypothetical protein
MNTLSPVPSEIYRESMGQLLVLYTQVDLLKYEGPNLYSREKATVASGETLLLRAVVGRVTATGLLKELDPAGADGTENPAGVLIEDVDASAADTLSVIIARHAILADHAVVWSAGITPTEQAAATAALETRGILIREGV